MAYIGGVNYEGKYFIVRVPADWTPSLPLPDPGPDDLWFDSIDTVKARLEGPRLHRPVRRPWPGTDSSWLHRTRQAALGGRSLNGSAPVIFATVPGALADAPAIRLAGGVTFEGRYFITPLPESWIETDPLPDAGPGDRWFDRQQEFVAALNGPWSRTRVRRQPFCVVRSSDS